MALLEAMLGLTVKVLPLLLSFPTSAASLAPVVSLLGLTGGFSLTLDVGDLD